MGVGDLLGGVVAVFVFDDDFEVFCGPDAVGLGFAYASASVVFGGVEDVADFVE